MTAAPAVYTVSRPAGPHGAALELARYTAHPGRVEISEVRVTDPTPAERAEMFAAYCAAVRRSLAHLLEATA
ncbi:hypothetical protein [Deinococcus sp. Marseille-Q6407]|uniref:hypothetical protein n=1 Tax=Deinococcus sp. Marseille-Q6407 TaxID=2969223 RepID=UPI0021C1AB82|nr:hypothetical protein [Deinococcus sp. Marseille-Q6407]